MLFLYVCNNKVTATTGATPKYNDTIDLITEQCSLMIHLKANKSSG